MLGIAEPTIIAKTGWTTDELAAAIPEQPGTFSLVSLLIGVNNQYRGRSLVDYRGEFSQLLDRAIGFANGRADRVLVLSIPDWGVTPFGVNEAPTRGDVSGEIDAFNAAARDVCEARGVRFVDITPASRRDASQVAEDGLHPSAEAYTTWTGIALPVARKLMAQ
jgi:lysophospholipase L1-like esterase